MPELGKKDQVFPVRVPRSGIVGWRKLYRVLEIILGRLGFKISFEGMDGHETVNGIHLRVKDTGTGGNFICTFDGTYISLSSGTVFGIVPNINGTLLNASPAPKLAAASTGTQIVYFKITATQLSAHAYMYSGTVTSVEVKVGSSLPANDPSGGFYYRQIATFINGHKTSQDITASQDGYVEDDGSASSKGNLIMGA